MRGKSEPFKTMRVLTPSTSLKSYQEMQGERETGFRTLYCGADPKEKSRLIVKSIVKLPVEQKQGGFRHIYCLEEASITSNYSHPQPSVQIQLRKLPEDFNFESKFSNEIGSLANELGYSLFYMNAGKNRMGAHA